MSAHACEVWSETYRVRGNECDPSRRLTPQAKAVMALYESDRTFRDHVSRYVHDFEAMLRQLLSTRDGHALGVTILSSDMGKLYVALAQSIERLRS